MISAPSSRFINIDILRGIAAFSVVLFHLVGSGSVFTGILSLQNLSLYNFIYFVPAYGYTGVYLFFVISGFCIHLRWAKQFSKSNEAPKIGFLNFWKRRWIRLYPAYLLAMLLFLLWQNYQGLISFNSLFIWDMVSHLLMIHNLDNRVAYSMNGVFWTLAIEEQLYLIYFVLLWLRQKWGWRWTLLICFTARFVWLAFILKFNRLNIMEVPFSEGALANWWIWALGALAIENYLGIIKLPRWCSSVFLSISFFLLAATLHYIEKNFSIPMLSKFNWVFEPNIWGAGFFLLINYVMIFEGKKYKSLIVNYNIKFWLGIGLISYSLYLTHEIILQMFSQLNSILVVVLAIIFAYFFFLIAEKPSMQYLAKQK